MELNVIGCLRKMHFLVACGSEALQEVLCGAFDRLQALLNHHFRYNQYPLYRQGCNKVSNK